MFTFFIVALSAVCTTQGFDLSQSFKNMHLSAKYGASLPEYDPPTQLDQVDQLASRVAEQFVLDHMPDPEPRFRMQYVPKYGPIENVTIPGLKLPRPITLKRIELIRQHEFVLSGIQWRVASNRVMCNASIPSLLLDVTFDNMEIELDENFENERFNTTIQLRIRLLDLNIFASARYNVKAMQSEQDFFIDKAEVDINAGEILVKLEVHEGLEEVRYVLTQIFNNPLQDILDAVLNVVVNEINKQLLGEMDPLDVTRYLISRLPKDSTVNKELLVISHL